MYVNVHVVNIFIVYCRGGRAGAYDRESIDNGPPGPARWSDSRDGPRSANYGSGGRWDDRLSDNKSTG